jgi:hypothetical protein
MALWNSWESRALFGDGAAFFIEIIHQQWPVHFYRARDFAMVASQLPLMSALLLGVTDLHWLARVLSFGMFALPTAFYHLALVHAREDAVLLAAVIIAIAAVFMTTSFNIAGEHSTGYAVAILAGVLLANNKRPSVAGGLLLAAVATFALRIYETFVFYGPLFAIKSVWLGYREPWPVIGSAGSPLLRATLFAGFVAALTAVSLIGRYAVFVPVGAVLVGSATWALVSASARPFVAGGLYALSAALFVASASIAGHSLITYVGPERFEETLQSSQEFWWNIQFDLAVGTVVAALVWALAFPEHLKAAKFYLWASVGPVLLALSPLLALVDGELGPLPVPQGDARVMAGLVVLATILFMWAYRSKSPHRPKALVVLRTPLAARRLSAWALLMLVASVPYQIVLTNAGSAFLQTMQSTIRDRSGLIAFEDTPLAAPPFVFLCDSHSLPSLSLALRSRPTDGIVLPERGYTGWVAMDPQNPPDLGRYFWRD